MSRSYVVFGKVVNLTLYNIHLPKMYWGARAILERESGLPGKALYLLPDRQSFERLEGSQRGQDVFFDWINTKVLPKLRRLARENHFYEWNDLVTAYQEKDQQFQAVDCKLNLKEGF